MDAALLLALGGADCERIGDGWLAQPVNALSSLAYVAAAGWLAGQARIRRRDRAFLAAASLALAAVGVGSAAYHGPQPGWAAVAHDGSIVALGAVLLSRSTWLVARRDARLGPAPVALRRLSGPAALMGSGLVAYVLGRTGSPVCRPGGLWQLHGVWHVLSAAALAASAVALATGTRAE